MKMYDLEVSINDGEIYISQDGSPEQDQVIVISADQVEVVVNWLRGAAKCIKTPSTGSEK